MRGALTEVAYVGFLQAPEKARQTFQAGPLLSYAVGMRLEEVGWGQKCPSARWCTSREPHRATGWPCCA